MSDLELHPEATPEPDVVRWRHAHASCTVPRGRLVTWPQALTDAGVCDIVAEDDALVMRLAPGQSWTRSGAGVRAALMEALTDAGSRFVAQPMAGPGVAERAEAGAVLASQPGRPPQDDLIAVQAAQVVDAVAQEVAHSHGGDIELLDVRGGVVTVRLRGACDGCPAAAMTLHRRIETELRARVEGVREVRAHTVERRGHGLERGGRALLQWAHERRR